MATVQFHKLHWEGYPWLPPGGEHHWWMVHSAWQDYPHSFVYSQVNITAHPWTFLPHYYELAPSELTVENVRSRLNADFGRSMHFTVRNLGPNPVGFYGIGISFIDE